MDKTLEELQVEYESLRKRNIEADLKAEKEKESKRVEEIRLQDEKKKKEEYEAEFKTKYGIGVQSKVNTEGSQQATNLTGDKEYNNFAQHFSARAQAQGLDIKGRTYLETLQNIKDKRRL